METTILVLGRDFLGDASEEREEAGSLAALGMTNQKGKGKSKNAFVLP
jgi:hypothetical protein